MAQRSKNRRDRDAAAWERIAANVGPSIEDARTKEGMTQPELAEAAGMDQGSISNIENGKRLPSIESLWKLSNALVRSSSDLLGF